MESQPTEMEICSMGDSKQVDFEEMFPRWFDEEDNCGKTCFVCARLKTHNNMYERGAFGVVTPHGKHVLKAIHSKHNITCSSALREMTAYSLMGTKCEQITRLVEMPAVDNIGNVTFTLEQAHGSLLYFARCYKIRKTLPGYEHMSIHFLLWSLLKGVAYMNKCDLVHRDLKPGNILVFPGPRIALCDFGGCRVVSDNLETLEAEMSDIVCTKNYAPPEENKRKHSVVFDSFSIASTIIHYAMSFVPSYKPLDAANRRAFTKMCKPYPRLLTIIKLLCRCDPSQRYSPKEALQLFETMYPQLVQKYEQFMIVFPGIPSRLSVMSPTCSWERFHNFKENLWPSIVEGILICQAGVKEYSIDRRSPLAVAYYVLNMLQNMHNETEHTPCTETRCYIMLIPCFIRTACLLVGSADDTNDYLHICHDLFKKHRCIQAEDVYAEANTAIENMYNCGINWHFPERLSTVVDLKNALHL
jgi:serine/threonine protein kinase